MNATADGWLYFHRADWAGARDAFAAALEADPGDPEALDGLGQSLWWLGDRDAGIDRRREAYAGYQLAGEGRRAGGLATYLAGEHRISGQPAEASGWLARAHRLLDDEDPCPELGWLAIEEAKRAGEPAGSEQHARAGLAIAHALRDPDIECMALAQLGRAIVDQGRVDEGLSLLDEAMTVALGGESSDPLACGDACCTTLVVCDGLADLDRATEWCEAVVEFNERRNFIPVQSWCRSIYGGVLVRSGDWEGAERVFTEALRRRPDRRRGAGDVLPLAGFAELRRRQGRREEAERLLDGLEGERPALAPLVRLHLDAGEIEHARALIDSYPDDRDEVLLPLRGDLELAAGDLEEAGRAAEGIAALAAELDREDLRARASLLVGEIAAARGEAIAARELGDAVARFERLGFPFEEGRARLALARAQSADGSPLALASARSALERFETLGARREADGAAALLRELGAGGRSSTRGPRDELTGREREVLELVVAGLSNPEIAERLFIAPKTAEHHVGRVLGKLGARSRTEAAALAIRDGLLADPQAG